MIDIQREKDEMDAIEAREAEALNDKMRAQGYEKCNMCGHWVQEEDLTHGMCESCVDNIITKTTVDQVADYASTLYDKHSKEDTELLLYTDYLFTRGEAIRILKEAAKEAEALGIVFTRKGIREYIENDTGDYLDYLEEKGAL